MNASHRSPPVLPEVNGVEDVTQLGEVPPRSFLDGIVGCLRCRAALESPRHPDGLVIAARVVIGMGGHFHWSKAQ